MGKIFRHNTHSAPRCLLPVFPIVGTPLCIAATIELIFPKDPRICGMPAIATLDWAAIKRPQAWDKPCSQMTGLVGDLGRDRKQISRPHIGPCAKKRARNPLRIA